MTEMKRPGAGPDRGRGNRHSPSAKGRMTMRKIPYRRPVRHHVFDLPLFRWSAMRCPPLTTGGRWLHRHRAVPRELADLVAELAGIGGEQHR
jgi:hypothetical protein